MITHVCLWSRAPQCSVVHEMQAASEQQQQSSSSSSSSGANCKCLLQSVVNAAGCDCLQAATAAAVQALKLAGGVLLIRRAVLPFKPLPPKW